MNLIYNLPQEIQDKIWEFDATYRDKLKICLLELEFYTPFWKSKNDNIFGITKSLLGYDNYYNNCKMISHIHNDCAEIDKRLTVNNIHSPEFLCDIVSRNDLIFKNIKSNKTIIRKIKENSLEIWLKKILKYT